MSYISEYDVENKFINRLEDIGYHFIKMDTYDDVLANFREQLARFNAKKLTEKGHAASFSDAEFERIRIHVENHSVYESAKILRDKYLLELDDGQTVYLDFFHRIQTGISIRLGFVAVCTQPVGSLFTIKLFEHFCNFFRYFHEAIRCIEWVIVPQIDNSHIDLRFGCWLMSDRNEGGGARHRGMTSGQHGPKLPHKNAKAPGRHKATRAHEMT